MSLISFKFNHGQGYHRKIAFYVDLFKEDLNGVFAHKKKNPINLNQ